MIKKLNISDSLVASKVIELQRKSYKIEAKIIGFDKIPPLIETLEELMLCNENFYGYYMESNLSGIISYKKEEQTMDIHRVAVEPKYFRKGIAQKLISFIEALDNNITQIIVSTGGANAPAINLYEKLGFKKVNCIKVENSLCIVCLSKVIKD